MLVTALEGGSDYWCSIVDESMIIKDDEKLLAERIFETIMTTNNQIPVEDGDTYQHLGVISFDSLQRGIERLQNEQPEHYNNMMDDSFDAETADVWLQLSVMGAVVFG